MNEPRQAAPPEDSGRQSPPLPPEKPRAAPPSARYASFPRRFAAYALDNLFIAVLTFFMTALAAKTAGGSPVSDMESAARMFWMVYGFYTAASAGYFTILIGGGGQTAGKRLLNIKVVRLDGSGVSYGRAFVRMIGYYISAIFIYIGFLIALIDPRSQTLHDKIAQTVVVEMD
ncbi:MAG: RDD family protein [Candidatus Nitrospinota bacterium M3_3B_026]